MTSYTWTWVNAFMLFILSFLFYITFLLIYNQWLSFSPVFYGIAGQMAQSSVFWLLLIMCCMLVYVLDTFIEMLRLMFAPK